MHMVTSKEILEACGIQSVKTLTRWHQAQLIPPPVVGRMPDGTPGKIGKWQGWVLDHCKEITRRSREGCRLSDIRDIYGTDWEAISRRYRRYNFAEVMAKRAAEEVDSLVDSLSKLQTQLSQLKPDDVGAICEEAEKLFHLRPVLIISAEDGAKVVSEERANLLYSMRDSPMVTMRFWDEGDYV